MIKVVISVSINFQAYGDNLKTFRDQVTPDEKLLFSNKTLNKALMDDPPEVLFAVTWIIYRLNKTN